MRLLLLAAVLCAPAASVAATDQPIAPANPAGEMPIVNPNGEAAAICPPTSRYEAARRGGPLAPHKLNQLPVADHYLSVYRQVDGCEVPVIAGYGIGTTQR
ncbi:MAG: hypothetical protein ABIW16_01500 [Sphingomicrobium sp.]